MSKLIEINLFKKEEKGISRKFTKKSKNSKISKLQSKKVKSGSDSGIESIGMSTHLLKKFNKGVAVSTSMIRDEIDRNIRLKIEILELKQNFRLAKQNKNRIKARKIKMLIKKKKLLYHTSKVCRPKGIS